MKTQRDFEKVIEIGEQFARASFLYRGTPAAGMLAWLDGQEMKQWWKADSAIVEPYPGGMFFINWSGQDESDQHAIYGVMDRVDTDSYRLEISKIYYMSPMGKMGPLHLEIHFDEAENGFTRMWLEHRHRHEGQLQKLYVAAVYASWPKTFALLVKYLEGGDEKQEE